ncbi:MAG: type III-A CRISPR-associated RAMP protein Csm3 [Chlorobiaceae bacterium]|nr:type III-A CRISPR-associated RAMP protein Csm3 [Chlorobiaceae bacterium]
MSKFTGKVFIRGRIVAKTGLHIGGSKTTLDIGAVDLNVIKTAEGLPFIPGSSLKGKLRSILAREEGSERVEDDSVIIKRIFGSAKDKVSGDSARLIVRDAFIAGDAREGDEGLCTETKWENTIDRTTGAARHPRQVERVLAGTEFDFEMVYNIYDDIKEEREWKGDLDAVFRAMHILEDDYLGGQGSRGYGRVCFRNVSVTRKLISDYSGGNQDSPLVLEGGDSVSFISGCHESDSADS